MCDEREELLAMREEKDVRNKLRLIKLVPCRNSLFGGGGKRGEAYLSEREEKDGHHERAIAFGKRMPREENRGGGGGGGVFPCKLWARETFLGEVTSPVVERRQKVNLFKKMPSREEAISTRVSAAGLV